MCPFYLDLTICLFSRFFVVVHVVFFCITFGDFYVFVFLFFSRCPDTNKPLGLMLLNGLTKLINEYKEVKLHMTKHILTAISYRLIYFNKLNNVFPCRILSYFVLPTLLWENFQGIMK